MAGVIALSYALSTHAAPLRLSAAPAVGMGTRLAVVPENAPDQSGIAAPSIAGVISSRRSMEPGGPAIEAYDYTMLGAGSWFAFPDGAGEGGLESGVGLLALPVVARPGDRNQPFTHVAISNLAQKSGFTDFSAYIYGDAQRDLVDYVCQRLNDGQSEYIDVGTWGYLNAGFRGSLMVSAIFWEHDVYGTDGQWLRNSLGLGGVADYWPPAPDPNVDAASSLVLAPLYVQDGVPAAPGYRGDGAPLCGSGGPPWPRRTPEHTPTATPTSTPTPSPTATPTSTPTPESAVEPRPPYAPVSPQIHLPALTGGDSGWQCAPEIAIQNVGTSAAKALIVLWGRSSCGPECNGPIAVVCTETIAPGSAVRLQSQSLPPEATSAVVYSFFAETFDADEGPCSDGWPFGSIVADCAGYAEFHHAYITGGDFAGLPIWALTGPPLVASVTRRCGEESPGAQATESYAGIAGPALGFPEPVPNQPSIEQFFYDLPRVVGADVGSAGEGSVIHIQNAAAGCAAVELWFQDEAACAPDLCFASEVAAGESITVDASTCAQAGRIGAGFIRSGGPVAAVVDTSAGGTLSSYVAAAHEIRGRTGEPLFQTHNTVLFAPLVYSRYAGWSSVVRVQNTGQESATLKVTLLDRNGDAAAERQLGPLCAGKSAELDLGAVAGLTWCWVGSVRVESFPLGIAVVAPPWLGPEPTEAPGSLGGVCGVPTPGPSPTATATAVTTEVPGQTATPGVGTATSSTPAARAWLPRVEKE